jgi:hypothetical protein
MSMQVIDEDQYSHADYYGAGRYTMTREEMGIRYGSPVIRILANPKDQVDMKQVHAQDTITVVQKNSGKHDVANFDPVSQKTVRDALLVLGTTILRFARVEKLGKAVAQSTPSNATCQTNLRLPKWRPGSGKALAKLTSASIVLESAASSI